MSGRARIGAWWFSPAPPDRLAALRILVGTFAVIYVIVMGPELSRIARLPASQFAPVGVVRLLGAPLAPWLALAIVLATVLLLVGFAAGIRYRISAPLAATALLWTLSYRSSWGMIFHTENLLVLHVGALACMPAADAWAVDQRAAPDPAGYGWAIRLLAVITVSTYVVAGVAKLRLGGWAWLDGDQLRHQIAFDNLRKAVLGDATAPFATSFLQHPSLCTAVSVLTLIVELGAPIALFGGRVAAVWIAAAWGFHVGVVLVMNIWFPYPLFGLAYLPLVPVERLFQAAARKARDRRHMGMDRP